MRDNFLPLFYNIFYRQLTNAKADCLCLQWNIFSLLPFFLRRTRKYIPQSYMHVVLVIMWEEWAHFDFATLKFKILANLKVELP